MIKKDHEVREFVNALRDLATKYHDHESLRERIAHVVIPFLAVSCSSEPAAVLSPVASDPVDVAVTASGATYYEPEKTYHWAEEYEAAHRAFDAEGVPRAKDEGTMGYSLFGRACRMRDDAVCHTAKVALDNYKDWLKLNATEKRNGEF